MMRKLLLAAVCLAPLAAHAQPALPPSAVLECQLQGEQAAAAASNPRYLVDLMAGAYGNQARDTCLRAKMARANEQRAVARVGKGLPWYCTDPNVTNPNVLAECDALAARAR